MVSDTAFIFHMHIPFAKTISLVSSSRSSASVNVKYRGKEFQPY